MMTYFSRQGHTRTEMKKKKLFIINVFMVTKAGNKSQNFINYSN